MTIKTVQDKTGSVSPDGAVTWVDDTNADLVQDRRTGEWYNPKDRFDAMMNKPEILAVFKRLAVR